MIESRIYLW